jgi:hypothetical protein
MCKGNYVYSVNTKMSVEAALLCVGKAVISHGFALSLIEGDTGVT